MGTDHHRTRIEPLQTNQAVVFLQPYTIKNGSFSQDSHHWQFGLSGPGWFLLPTAHRRTAMAPSPELLELPATGKASGLRIPWPYPVEISKWIPVVTAEGLSLSLGLKPGASCTWCVSNPPGNSLHLLSLRNGFALRPHQSEAPSQYPFSCPPHPTSAARAAPAPWPSLRLPLLVEGHRRRGPGLPAGF